MIKWAFCIIVLGSLAVIGVLLHEAFRVFRNLE